MSPEADRPDELESRALLAEARRAIEAAVGAPAAAGAPCARSDHEPPSVARGERLRRPGASFVTLRSADGSLRGCIGELEARRPLLESVRGCAVGAATRDPRFTPVSASEIPHLRIGISVLTSPTPIRPDEVEVGRHGLLVERGWHRGVLLPEVAADHGWDARAFLEATCRKAGLAPDAWREPDTKLSAFETIKLQE